MVILKRAEYTVLLPESGNLVPRPFLTSWALMLSGRRNRMLYSPVPDLEAGVLNGEAQG